MNQVSGTPGYFSHGAKDSSGAKLVPQEQEIGTVVLNSVIFASKGPVAATINGSNVMSVFGEETFNILGEYYQHPTRFLTRFLGFGSSADITRAIPDDANNPANVSVYIDVLECKLPNYIRDSFGNLVYEAGSPKIDTTTPEIDGYKIKFIKDYKNKTGMAPELGSLIPLPGTMSYDNGTEIVKSTMYPLIQANGTNQGKDYNNLGFGFDSFGSDDVDPDLLKELGAMLYGFKMYRKLETSTTPKIIETLEAENILTCALKPNLKNPNTKANISLDTIFSEKYYNETITDGSVEMRYEDAQFFIYQEYLEFILNKIAETEAPHISTVLQTWDDGEIEANIEWFDFSNEDLTGEAFLINIFTCMSTSDKRYYTVMLDDSEPDYSEIDAIPGMSSENMNVIDIGNNTPIMLNGGSDGTMTLETLNNKTSMMLDEYADISSPRQNLTVYNANYFVDSGYPIEVKEKAFHFITLRKDTNILLSTESVTEMKARRFSLTNSIAVLRAMQARALLSPESTYYNTECARVAVVVGCEKQPGLTEYVPLTFEIIDKII